jgi:hypothetical protein
MNEYHKATHFCMSLSTSIEYMREAFASSVDKACIKDLQWPQDVHLELDEEENEGYPATIYYHPTDTKNPPHATLAQFMFVCGHVMGSHWNSCEFKINASSENPRFFYPAHDSGGEQHGGFYLDETKIQGEAVMTLNKIRELCR